MTIVVCVERDPGGGFVARCDHWGIITRSRTRPATAKLAHLCIAAEALRRGLWRNGGIWRVHVRYIVAETERERRRRLRRAN
jgi:hypothetical protein